MGAIVEGDQLEREKHQDLLSSMGMGTDSGKTTAEGLLHSWDEIAN